jgi:putative restriction endonuclease
VKSYVGVTDSEWFELLRSQDALEEVNFWQPGGSRQFKSLEPGELFLFKLHSPRNFIVGGGIFAHSSLLPVSLAWQSFGIGNGVSSLEEMRKRTLKYRREARESRNDFTVGCILLTQPFFLSKDQWIPVPADWSRNIVQGKTYDLTKEPGATLYQQLHKALFTTEIRDEGVERYGRPMVFKPRLGQGAFRVLVTDAYQRRCALTGERVLPVLEAAHVRPYAAGGSHAVQNGILLRSDLHTLFDRGYLTVTRDHRVEVSKRIREEFQNGREYYELHGSRIRGPDRDDRIVTPENIEWHNENVFLGH